MSVDANCGAVRPWLEKAYIAKSAAPACALRETVRPYSGPTVSSGGNDTNLYCGDAAGRSRCAPEQ